MLSYEKQTKIIAYVDQKHVIFHAFMALSCHLTYQSFIQLPYLFSLSDDIKPIHFALLIMGSCLCVLSPIRIIKLITVLYKLHLLCDSVVIKFKLEHKETIFKRENLDPGITTLKIISSLVSLIIE